MKTLARRPEAEALLRRLHGVRPESEARWGRMSAHQMVCHTADGLRMMLGEKGVTRVTGALAATLARWIALYAPWRWPAAFIRTTPELDQDLDGTRPVDFATDKAQLRTLVERVMTQPAIVDRRLHPIFGRMSRAAWLRWAYLHLDHHLRQFGA